MLAEYRWVRQGYLIGQRSKRANSTLVNDEKVAEPGAREIILLSRTNRLVNPASEQAGQRLEVVLATTTASEASLGSCKICREV